MSSCGLVGPTASNGNAPGTAGARRGPLSRNRKGAASASFVPTHRARPQLGRRDRSRPRRTTWQPISHSRISQSVAIVLLLLYPAWQLATVSPCLMGMAEAPVRPGIQNPLAEEYSTESGYPQRLCEADMSFHAALARRDMTWTCPAS